MRKGVPSALSASPQMTSCGAEEAGPGGPEPGARSLLSRSERGRSRRGDKLLEDRGKFFAAVFAAFASNDQQQVKFKKVLLKVSGDNVFSAELPEKFQTCPISGAVCREECRDMPAESGETGNKRDNSVPDGPRCSLRVVGLKRDPADRWSHHRDPSPIWAGKVCQCGICFVFDSRKPTTLLFGPLLLSLQLRAARAKSIQ